MSKAVFYHAGCPVCVDAEQLILKYLDPSKVEVETVNLDTDSYRIDEADRAGVKSVPALVIHGQVYHINFGASMEDIKRG